MSESFPIREYSDICKIVSQIAWNLYKNVTHALNTHASVSIDTNIYKCEMNYNMKYNIFRNFPSCAHWAFIDSTLTNFYQ